MACEVSNVTYILQVKGEESLSTKMACKESEITYSLVKEKGISSAQIACEESEVTYSLQGEGRGFVSPDGMRGKRGHLHPAGEGRGEFVSQDGIRRIQDRLLAGG